MVAPGKKVFFHRGVLVSVIIRKHLKWSGHNCVSGIHKIQWSCGVLCSSGKTACLRFRQKLEAVLPSGLPNTQLHLGGKRPLVWGREEHSKQLPPFISTTCLSTNLCLRIGHLSRLSPSPIPYAVFVVVFQHAFMKCTYLSPSSSSVAYIPGLFSRIALSLPPKPRKYQIEHGCL